MVEIKTKWTEENLKDYTRFIIFNKSKLNKYLYIAMLVLYVLILAGCLTVYFAMHFDFALIMLLGFTFFLAVCILIYAFILKDFVKTTLKSNENEAFDSVLINSNNIFICKDQQPIGELDWEQIVKIYINEKCGAVYLCTQENAILILEYKNITGGTQQELIETVKEKNDKLSKKA